MANGLMTRTEVLDLQARVEARERGRGRINTDRLPAGLRGRLHDGVDDVYRRKSGDTTADHAAYAAAAVKRDLRRARNRKIAGIPDPVIVAEAKPIVRRARKPKVVAAPAESSPAVSVSDAMAAIAIDAVKAALIEAGS